MGKISVEEALLRIKQKEAITSEKEFQIKDVYADEEWQDYCCSFENFELNARVSK